MPSVRLGVHGRRWVLWLGVGVVVAASLAGRASAGLTFVVTTTADSGPGSLRQAISDANANAGLDTIAFAIPGGGVHTIQPLTALPVVTDPVVIDGRTEPGWEFPGPPVVQLLGPGKSPATFDYLIGAGLEIDGGRSVVEGLAVGGFGTGIDLESSGNDIIQFDVV